MTEKSVYASVVKWQPRKTQNLVPKGVRVRLPPGVRVLVKMTTNNEKKKLRRRCASGYTYRCVDIGTANVDIFWQEDPFASEIHGDDTKMWLCGPCAEHLWHET